MAAKLGRKEILCREEINQVTPPSRNAWRDTLKKVTKNAAWEPKNQKSALGPPSTKPPVAEEKTAPVGKIAEILRRKTPLKTRK
jgi:hypothetical protein